MSLRTLLLSAVLLCGNALSARTIYVKQGATGANNGSAWLNAYTNLVPALTAAQAGDTIRVAQGTYKPGSTQSSTFLMKNGVVVLGGYATDTTITQPDWRRYPTILSGEIGSASTLFDNVIHILESIGVNAATLWDGFVVERGYGGNSGSPVILHSGSACTLRNFLFRSNQTGSATGSVLTITSSSPVFENCVFTANGDAGSDAWGTVLCSGGSPSFYNCVFARNSSRTRVSGVAVSSGSPRIVNCTFFGNETGNAGQYDMSQAGTLWAATGSTVQVSNSIFYENRVYSPGRGFTSDSLELVGPGSYSVANSLTQNWLTGTNVIPSVSPRFRDTSNLAGPDGIWASADDGLQLTAPCSPALNAGDNSAIGAIANDLAGSPRRYNGGAVDMGAYEFQGAPGTALRTVYVKKTATSAGDGSSWTNAFTDLQKALQYCADTIKVAAGTYLPDPANPEASFWIENGKVLLGGYPATGDPTDAQNDPALNKTILSGKLSATVNSLRIVRARHVDSTTLVSGFTIRDCAPGESLFSGDRADRGGLFLTNSAALTILRCRITQNSYGAYLDGNAAPRFLDCVIDSNYQSGILSRFSRPAFRRSVFVANHTILNSSLLMYNGGAVYQHYSQTQFDSCAFTANEANLYGGALWATGGTMLITRSQFRDNMARDAGGSLFADGASTVLQDCFFRDSVRNIYGGSVYIGAGTLSALRCQFRNGRSSYGQVYTGNRAQATFTATVFDNNSASGQGAALYCGPYSVIRMENCIAANNRAGVGGFLYNNKSVVTLVNCTGLNNSGSTGSIVNRDSATLVLRNTLLWGNPGSTVFAPIPEIVNEVNINYLPSTTSMSHSVTQFYGTNGVDGNTVGVNPRLVEWTDADGADNQYFTADDGARLTACSPVLNTGDNSFVTQSTDITGAPRIAEGTVDPGAYEYSPVAGTALRSVYVKASATGANDGSSWQHAYTSLWSALNNSCADTIRVAAGTYIPAMTSRDSGFVIRHSKYILGGYPATGNPQDPDRDPQVYRTILSGNIGNPADSTDNVYHVLSIVSADTAVVLDGLTIERGTANGPDNSRALGGGIFCSGTPLTLFSCTLRNNAAANGGGGIYAAGSRLQMRRCVVERNTCAASGGGLSLASQNTILENCVFSANVSAAGGGGLYNAGGVLCSNTLFSGNKAYQGGAVYNASLNATYVQNTFFRNAATWGWGSGMFNATSNSSDPGWPRIYNSIFHQNFWTPSSENYVGGELYDQACGVSACQRTQIRYNRLQGSNIAFVMTNSHAQPAFVNENNPAGGDGIWFTADDGLRLSACSPLVDYGSAADAAGITSDALGNPRIVNSKPDLGPYEFNGAPQGLPQNLPLNDSLIANREYNTADGWTHYYKDCQYLLSIYKNGQDIGTVASGLRVKAGTNSLYGSGQSTNLSGAAYLNGSSTPWLTMNHYWKVTPAVAVTGEVLVRFPFGNKDVNDLAGSNPSITTPSQIRFFATSGVLHPLDPAIPATAFTLFTQGPAPSSTEWTWSQFDSLQLATYRSQLPGGGSGGAFFNGPLPDLQIGTATAPASVPVYSPVTITFTEKNEGAGSAGQRQVYFYVSTDDVLTPGSNGDTVLARQTVTETLAAGATSAARTQSFTLPCGLAPGNYWVFVVTDASNAIPESNESNNSFRLPLTVTAGNNQPPTPVINAAPSASVCRNTTYEVVLSASNTNCAGCTLQWSGGQTTPAISVTTSGTYTVTLNNGCGSSSASQTVAFNYAPVVDFTTSPATPCADVPFTLTATGAQTYTWTGPGLTSNTGAQVTSQLGYSGSTVSFSVTGTDANGCKTSVTKTIFVGSASSLDILQYDVQICEGGSTPLQTANGANGMALVWSPATGLSSTSAASITASPATTTTYTLTGTNSYGCVSRDSVTVIVLPAGNCDTPAPDLIVTNVFYVNGTATVGETLNGSFRVFNQGNASAGTSAVKMYLSADATLTPDANGDVQLGGPFAVIGLNAGQSTGGMNYSVSVPCGLATGNYYLFFLADANNQVAESNENNNAFASVPVRINGINLAVTPADPQICAGGTVTLSATGANTYTWSPATGLNNTGAATVVASPSSTTTYTVSGHINPCPSVTTTVTVTVRPAVTPSVTVAFTGCPSGTLQFTATPTNGGTAPTFAWFVDGALSGTGNPFTLSNAASTTQVYAVMTGNAACASAPTAQSATVTSSCVQTAVSNLPGVDKLWLSPNPATENVVVHLQLRNRQQLTLRLLAPDGRELYRSKPEAVSGTVARVIPTGGFAAGVYLLQILVDGKLHTERIVLLR